MSPARYLLAVVAITLLSGHVAPSVDDNNRYLKLTPLGDRVRLAYTVFFGEVPGASERRTVDADRDGRISDAEAHAFGEHLAAQVASALVVEVDGHVQPVRWSIVDTGMGTPVVAAGAFSVDMVTYLCLPTARGRHHVTLHDRFRVTRPGETEVKVEDSPGVTIERARVGPADDPSFDYRFVGPGGPLQDDGLDLVFDAGPSSTVTADSTCRAATRRRTGGALVALVAALAAIVLVTAWRVARRKRAGS